MPDQVTESTLCEKPTNHLDLMERVETALQAYTDAREHLREVLNTTDRTLDDTVAYYRYLEGMGVALAPRGTAEQITVVRQCSREARRVLMGDSVEVTTDDTFTTSA